MNKHQKQYVAFLESVCSKFNCKEAIPALQEGFKAFCEASSELDSQFEGTKYGYQWEFNEPGEEPVISKFGTPDYSANYNPYERKSYAKDLARMARNFGETSPRFGKPMVKTRKDGSSTTLTPMKKDWDDTYTRGKKIIPKSIQERVNKFILDNDWDIRLNRTGIESESFKDDTELGGYGFKYHRDLPTEYRGFIDDPVVVNEITRKLAPLGFRHDTDTVESQYGSTGHGPIDTESFLVHVWKYTGQPDQVK